MEYQDNESTIVSDTSHPELLFCHIYCKFSFFFKIFYFSFCQSNITIHTDREGGGFTTDSTIPDTSSVVSVQSSVSTRSSRSGLTRQGNCDTMIKNSSWPLYNNIEKHTQRITNYIICTDWIQFKLICFKDQRIKLSSFLSCFCRPRVNIQAFELWEKIRKDEKKTTQEDRCGYPTSCSERVGYAASF